ncbi:2-dehydropantoate 2-reductase [bacterium]|nr:2-dehydropantoate 2-reductase [bacterium]
MKVVVMGAGAVGGYYGGRLSQSGCDVSVICRSDYDIIKEKGIRIQSIKGDMNWTPTQVCRHPKDFVGSVDVVIVSTKNIPGDGVCDSIAPLIGPSTTILLIQNGMFIEVPYKLRYPSTPILSGLAFICVSRVFPGGLNHSDYGMITIGLHPEGASDLAASLASLWKESGVKCILSPTIQKNRWEKLIWNAPFNPLSLLNNGRTTQEILEQDLPRVKAIMSEVMQLALIEGYPLDPNIMELKINQTAEMTPYKTSMLLDFESKRPIELDAILSAPIAFGEKNGVALPEMKRLYEAVLSIKIVK